MGPSRQMCHPSERHRWPRAQRTLRSSQIRSDSDAGGGGSGLPTCRTKVRAFSYGRVGTTHAPQIRFCAASRWVTSVSWMGCGEGGRHRKPHPRRVAAVKGEECGRPPGNPQQRGCVEGGLWAPPTHEARVDPLHTTTHHSTTQAKFPSATKASKEKVGQKIGIPGNTVEGGGTLSPTTHRVSRVPILPCPAKQWTPSGRKVGLAGKNLLADPQMGSPGWHCERPRQILCKKKTKTARKPQKFSPRISAGQLTFHPFPPIFDHFCVSRGKQSVDARKD